MFPISSYHFTPYEALFLGSWLVVFTAIIYRYGRLEGMPLGATMSLWATKIIAVLAYIAYHNRSADGGDAYHYFYYSHVLTDAFRENPSYYLRLLLGANDTFVPNTIYKYAWELEFWSDDDSYTILRFHAFLRLFSGGFYTVHAACMAFLLFWASRSNYHIFQKNSALLTSLPAKTASHCVAATVFLIPSVWFWTAGIHKDGFIYIGLSGILVGFIGLSRFFTNLTTASSISFYLKNSVFPRQKREIFLFFGGLFLLTACRSYLLTALLPALFLGLFFTFFPQKGVKTYITLLFLGILVAFCIIEVANIPFLEKLVWKQREFISEWGNLDTDLPILAPNWLSLVKNTPLALKNALFQPFFWEHKSVILLSMALEPIFILVWTMVLGSLLFLKKNTKNLSFSLSPLSYFLLTYCLFNLILVGLLTANIGTLVRYRTVALSLIPLVVLALKSTKKAANSLMLRRGVLEEGKYE